MSVSSSIYDYVVENGRTYHRYKEGKYMLPNDEVSLSPLAASVLFSPRSNDPTAPVGIALTLSKTSPSRID